MLLLVGWVRTQLDAILKFHKAPLYEPLSHDLNGVLVGVVTLKCAMCALCIWSYQIGWLKE